METDLHLQISQHQAHFKNENCTVSYHSYELPHITTAKHFAATATFQLYTLHFTASTIWGLQKIRVGWNGELPLHVLILKCF